MNNKFQRLFVDMDGTLAVFRSVDTLEKLYEKDYFANLEPQMNVIDGIRHIIRNNPNIEVFVLSAVLSDSPYAVPEKNEWLDKYLPEVDAEHRLYPACGESKKEFLKGSYGGVRSDDFLLDDYSKNLHEWEPPAKGIKVMNGINGKNGTWTKDKVSIECDGNTFAECVVNIMQRRSQEYDLSNRIPNRPARGGQRQ